MSLGKKQVLVLGTLLLSTALVFQNCGKGSHNNNESTEKEQGSSVKTIFSETFDTATVLVQNEEDNGFDYGKLFIQLDDEENVAPIQADAGNKGTKGLELLKGSVKLSDGLSINTTKKHRISVDARLVEYSPQGSSSPKPIITVSILHKSGDDVDVVLKKDVLINNLEWQKYEVIVEAGSSDGQNAAGYSVDVNITSSLETKNIIHIDNILVEQL